ncbi:sensor histidine kinase [Bacteroides sp. UBA939]|uniref:sensor histidine kinase n=1 Tax=Bacteroides sp. UBA939 TaxID=1946092 RepID=UPI0025C16E7C|nr:hybrid sensor histidine kinase/response regulator [Bacteroides sp. UBA939]
MQKEEQEVARLNQIAEEANEIKSRFLANMSYNIRIPLNNVVGFSQLLSTDSELSESEKLEYSTIIRENTTELIQLVNDVLDLSRLEAQMMKFQIQDCEIREMCNDLIYMAQMNSKEHIRIELETDVESLWFKTDANRFNQAVLSMLVYPVAQEAERDIKIQLNKEEEKGLLVFHITNSPLSDPAFASQKVFVRHRINQLLFEHFGGSYVVSPNSEDGYLITFTISFRIE